MQCLPLTIVKSVISPIKIVDKYRAFFVRSFSVAFCYSHFLSSEETVKLIFFLSNYYCVRGSAIESVAFSRFYLPIRFWCVLDHCKANHDCFSNCEKIPASYRPEHFRRSLTGSPDCYLAASLSDVLAS